jgi:hypothetical protein
LVRVAVPQRGDEMHEDQDGDRCLRGRRPRPPG